MKLLADIDQKSDKKPWQSYAIKHGIEVINALLPLNNVIAFEACLSEQEITSKQELLELISEHGGELS